MPTAYTLPADLTPFDRFVAHCTQDTHWDVYVGRGRCPRTKQYGRYGNLWSHLNGTLAEYKVDTVEEAIVAHREWVLSQPELISQIRAELRGKVLACWCRTKGKPNAPCHALTLAAIANSV